MLHDCRCNATTLNQFKFMHLPSYSILFSYRDLSQVPMPAPHSRAHGPSKDQLSAFAIYWAALKLQRAIRSRQRKVGPSDAWITARSTVACVVKLQRCVRQHMRQVGPSEARLLQRRESAAAKCLQTHTRARQAAQHKAARMVQHHARKHLHHKHTPVEYDVRNGTRIDMYIFALHIKEWDFVAYSLDVGLGSSCGMPAVSIQICIFLAFHSLSLHLILSLCALELAYCPLKFVCMRLISSPCFLLTSFLLPPTTFVDRSVVGFAVAQCADALGEASRDLRSDKPLVMAAVTSDGLALRFASVLLRCDREVVLAAATQNGCALAFATKALRGDHEVIVCVTGKIRVRKVIRRGCFKRSKT